MNFNSQCVLRLKEERKRLRLSQGDIADTCGISREMWGKYERGIAVPGGEVLASLAISGANIQYILTGHKSQENEINADEYELLNMYRNAPLSIKAAALGALTAGTAQQAGVNISNNTIRGEGQIAGGNIYTTRRRKTK
ncbi:helix-turn-helix transcriptional regulator [Gilliamella sp. B2776]|uniref:helix-turn-helix domain-containing protein n=1 Tax=unclassified Gilliamella TaxID=2685620 RepID=UPI00226AE75F|nr:MULTISPECIES: helix-turn-helix transcriptional regulator [unclassified Gilliamella]MCX8650044.1 helix-turn-helix transcriptional regulator [Gilliamella sp. B2779]MCX8654977.1 helix-turn-helix transcriptional regulator [Gilliamella sp. B2737]MCX8691817.1 helix-turn-helix transcriptional regulator [Gilliamella sp. B2776]MCX8701677.1 helix-turn-helix transcriptional regulator [Gilliamella sp. B2840]MCX8702942.1 helix-turn-helix transcriptional regulator [Gilliamella sp. B2781]